MLFAELSRGGGHERGEGGVGAFGRGGGWA